MSAIRDDLKFVIYQGEDVSIEIVLDGDGAPTSLDEWQAYMEIRSKKASRELLVRRSTDPGEGITVVEGAAAPTFLVAIPKALTREFPEGTYGTDMFLVPDSGDTFPPFAGEVEVKRRWTIEEGEA